jgi:hypothetical protein
MGNLANVFFNQIQRGRMGSIWHREIPNVGVKQNRLVQLHVGVQYDLGRSCIEPLRSFNPYREIDSQPCAGLY